MQMREWEREAEVLKSKVKEGTRTVAEKER
jgi:hypothetical protein